MKETVEIKLSLVKAIKIACSKLDLDEETACYAEYVSLFKAQNEDQGALVGGVPRMSRVEPHWRIHFVLSQEHLADIPGGDELLDEYTKPEYVYASSVEHIVVVFENGDAFHCNEVWAHNRSTDSADASASPES